jgi:hypothetical protein
MRPVICPTVATPPALRPMQRPHLRGRAQTVDHTKWGCGRSLTAIWTPRPRGDPPRPSSRDFGWLQTACHVPTAVPGGAGQRRSGATTTNTAVPIGSSSLQAAAPERHSRKPHPQCGKTTPQTSSPALATSPTALMPIVATAMKASFAGWDMCNSAGGQRHDLEPEQDDNQLSDGVDCVPP